MARSFRREGDRWRGRRRHGLARAVCFKNLDVVGQVGHRWAAESRREADAAFQLPGPAFANRKVFQLRHANSARIASSAGVLRAPHADVAARCALRGEEWTFLHIIY